MLSDKYISMVMGGKPAAKVLDEYLAARNVHGYKTKTNLTDLSKYFKGWAVITNKPALIKYGIKTQLGLFIYGAKYESQGVRLEVFWPKQYGPELKGGLLFKKKVTGKLVGNSYGFSIVLPVSKGSVFKDYASLKAVAKMMSNAATRAEKRYLATDDEEEANGSELEEPSKIKRPKKDMEGGNYDIPAVRPLR